MLTPQCIWPAETVLGEAPFWSVDEQALYWVDIDGRSVLRYDRERDTREVFPQAHEIGCILPKRSGGFVAAVDDGLAFIGAGLDSIDVFAMPESHMPRTRFNDGQCDRLGRFWAASADREETEPLGAIYRLDETGKLSREISGIKVGNGLAWSPDNRTMYFADTGYGTIYALDYDIEQGVASNRRIFARVDEIHGYPDGLTVDAEGFIWNAHWSGWRVTRYDPAGKVERIVELPVPNVTSLTFGGPRMDLLFITSARLGLSNAQITEAPQSGGLFVVETDVKGIPESAFAG